LYLQAQASAAEQVLSGNLGADAARKRVDASARAAAQQ